MMNESQSISAPGKSAVYPFQVNMLASHLLCTDLPLSS